MRRNRIKKYISLAALVLMMTVASTVSAFDFSSPTQTEPGSLFFKHGNQLVVLKPAHSALSLSTFNNFFPATASPELQFSFAHNFVRPAAPLSSFDGYPGLMTPLGIGSLPPLQQSAFIPQAEYHQLKAAGDMQFGQFYVSSEFTWDITDVALNDTTMEKKSAETFSFALDTGKKWENMQAGLMYYYSSGEKSPFQLSNRQHSGPAYILNGSNNGMFQFGPGNMTDLADFVKESGIQALILHSDLALSDRLRLHGGLIYGMGADDLADMNIYGLEIDLGASYAIFNNLLYEVNFGYLDAGSIMKQFNDANDPDDMFLLTHQLTLEF